MRKSTKTSPYAVAMATATQLYGHLEINLYELLGFGAGTIKIGCQTGGSHADGLDKVSYAWKCGLQNDYGVLELGTLKQGVSILTKINNQLAKQREADYRVGHTMTSFAEYASRILASSGVRTIYINRNINQGYQKLEDLPALDVRRNRDLVVEYLAELEQKLICKTAYARTV